MLRKITLSFLCLALSSAPALAACEHPKDASIWEKALMTWVNGERKAIGLPAFRQNGKLQKAARQHGCDMVDHDYFAHQRRGGPDLRARLKGVGYNLRFAGENLAYTRQPDPGTAAEIWRNSAVHWDAMLNPDYSEAGISIVTGNGKYYWVMDMGKTK